MSRVRAHSGDIADFMVVDDRLSILLIAANYAVTIAIILLAIKIDHPIATAVAIVLVAGRQVGFLNLVHAAGHHSLFSKRNTNYKVDLFVGYPVLDAVRPYRSYHLAHHREFTRKDPDRFDYLEERLPGHDDGPWHRTWEIVIKPIFGEAGFSYLRFTIDQARENPWWVWRLGVYWVVVLTVFFFAGWLKYLLLYWFLPLVWLYPVLYGWAELSDHYAVENEARNQRGLFYMLFLKGNEMYHAVHHRYPRIPFYRVKAAGEYMKSLGETFEETRGPIDFLKILYRRVPEREGEESALEEAEA